MKNTFLGTELPIIAACGSKIKCGDFLDIEFGTSSVRPKHLNVQVYFDEESLQFCVKGGNITSTVFKNSLVGYVNPIYTITTKHPY